MEIFWVTCVAMMLGGSIGSFSGVLLSPKKKRSIWTGRSMCDTCQSPLHWYELIPVFSYIFGKGVCCTCSAPIGRWVWYIEIYNSVLWGIFTLLMYEDYTLSTIFLHLIIVSTLCLLAIEDGRSYTISDSFSGPLACGILLILSLSLPGIFPTLGQGLLGAGIGLFFYSLQMIIPTIGYFWGKKNYTLMIQAISTLFFFPFWWIAKGLFGEKKSLAIIPSIGVFDNVKTWVGGGDIRLGIIVGLLMGPQGFFWVIMWGYTFGSIYWGIQTLAGRKIEILPVAPLIFFGIVVTWIIKILF